MSARNPAAQMAEWIESKVDLTDKVVVDFSCGDGSLLAAIASSSAPAAAFGVEADPCARPQAASLPPSVRVLSERSQLPMAMSLAAKGRKCVGIFRGCLHRMSGTLPGGQTEWEEALAYAASFCDEIVAIDYADGPSPIPTAKQVRAMVLSWGVDWFSRHVARFGLDARRAVLTHAADPAHPTADVYSFDPLAGEGALLGYSIAASATGADGVALSSEEEVLGLSPKAILGGAHASMTVYRKGGQRAKRAKGRGRRGHAKRKQ